MAVFSTESRKSEECVSLLRMRGTLAVKNVDDIKAGS
jgi:hypothetical protein